MLADPIDKLTPRDFQRLALFIQDYSGIKMPPTKKTMVEGRLRRRSRATGRLNLTDYCRYLFDEGGLDEESVHLIDAVTTNKTDFFREVEHFSFLSEVAIPKLLARPGHGRTPIKIWSAACSSGAEPYSIAMLLADMQRDYDALRFSILATDICTEVLHTAATAIYPEQMIEPVPHDMRQRYLLRSKDRSQRQVRIAPELRDTVEFGRVNLIEPPYPADRQMDLIFCRNLLIYFDKPTQKFVLQNLCEHLQPGGYLFLGHSETVVGLDLPVTTVGPTVFQRV